MCTGTDTDLVLTRAVPTPPPVVSAGALVEALWSSRPPAAPVAALQAHVSHLRRSLEPDRPPRARTTTIWREPPGYVLRLPDDAVDAWQFEDIVTATTSADAVVVLRHLDRAVALWRGPAYAEVADEPWAAAAVGRLNELHVVAQERWCTAALAGGRVTDAVLRAECLTRSCPLREEGWRLLALALYADGRQPEALGALRRARSALAEELGLDIGQALTRLEIDIVQQPTRCSTPHPHTCRLPYAWGPAAMPSQTTSWDVARRWRPCGRQPTGHAGPGRGRWCS